MTPKPVTSFVPLCPESVTKEGVSQGTRKCVCVCVICDTISKCSPVPKMSGRGGAAEGRESTETALAPGLGSCLD